jgi:hypothetical protein
LPHEQQLRPDAFGEEFGGTPIERHALAFRLLARERRHLPATARGIAADCGRWIPEGPGPARPPVHLRGHHHQHHIARCAEGGDRFGDRIGQRLRAPARAFGLAQYHEPALGHYGQRSDGVQQRRRPRALAVEPIEIEILRSAGENRLPQQGQCVISHQELLANHQVGGADRPFRELRAKLREVHRGAASTRFS